MPDWRSIAALSSRGEDVPDRAWELRLGGVVCGVDEVGRGPLAGPVVAAAVILPGELPAELEGLDDSKALTAAVRLRYASALMGCAKIGLGAASVAEIDQYNILKATFIAIERAV